MTRQVKICVLSCRHDSGIHMHATIYTPSGVVEDAPVIFIGYVSSTVDPAQKHNYYVPLLDRYAMQQVQLAYDCNRLSMSVLCKCSR